MWQTRSEYNGLNSYATKEEAFRAALDDPSVWKVSGEGHRVVRQEDGSWVDEPMEEIVRRTVEKYKQLMSDPETRKAFEDELAEWDATLQDGLE